jgi:RNA polymerase primary sigma factor
MTTSSTETGFAEIIEPIQQLVEPSCSPQELVAIQEEIRETRGESSEALQDCQPQRTYKEIMQDIEEGKISFISLEAVKVFLKKAYKLQGHKEPDPLRLIPGGWLKALIEESFARTPWVNMQGLMMDLDGEERLISYSAFRKTDRLDEFRRYHEEARKAYLNTFDRVCEFAAHPSFKMYGGWDVIRDWWEEVIERAFRQTPFTNLKELRLTHKGATIGNPYEGAIKKGKKSEKLRALKAVYDRVLQDYLEESYEHARAYILHQRFLGPEDGWNNVPAKWHKQFCAEAFTENPFQSPGNTKLKGRSLPIDYYSRREEHAKLKEMYDEVFEEYLSNIDRVMDFLESNEKVWRKVPRRFHKVVVVNAVMTAEKENPSRKRLVFKRKGRERPLEGLYQMYLNDEELDVFESYYEEGLRYRRQLQQEKQEPQEEKPKLEKRSIRESRKIDDVLPYDELLDLIELAKEGDLEARKKVIMSITRFIRMIASRFAKQNQAIIGDLIQDGILVADKCIDSFEPSGSANFITYLGAALKNDFLSRVLVYQKGLPEAEARQSVNMYFKFKKAIPGIDPGKADPEEIAEATGKDIRSVITAQRRIRGSHLSLSMPIGDEEDLTLMDTLTDECMGSQEDPVIKESGMELLERVMGHLGIREQIIVKQYFGIENGARFSPYQIRREMKDPSLIDRMKEAVSQFQQELIEFCRENPMSLPAGKISQLMGIATSSTDVEETLNGDNALGILLTGTLDSNMKQICITVIDSLSKVDQLIVTEIFNIPRSRKQTLESIGDFFGLSRERIRQIMKKNIMPKLKRKLKIEYGVGFDSIISTSDERPVGVRETLL